MTGKHRTSVYHHVLTRTATTTTVGVFSALDTDTVVTGIKLGVYNQGVLARFEIKGITVLRIRWVSSKYIVYYDVLAHQRMYVPSGGILENNALQQHVLAIDETHHHGAQETFDAFPVVFRLHSLRHIHVSSGIALGIPLGGEPQVGTFQHAALAGERLPLCLGHLRFFERTPVLAVTIYSPFAGYGNVSGSVCAQRRLATACLKSLERCADKRIE